MSSPMLCRALTVVLLLVVAGCGDDESSSHGMSMGDDVAPEQLVVDGNYSDERFIDMMAAHRQMATEMAMVEEQRGTRQELRALATKMIQDQRQEIDELKALKQAHFGSSDVPTMMSESEMQNSGMLMPDELAQKPDVDKAFIDSMMPHHAGAIQMATVALQRSSIAEIRAMSRRIIDAQAEEVGQLIEWRKAWYGSQP
ncbi:DUF305 domain-containing protein [Myxococcus llanfairpwllgwyngyllgogerychwyrndrobwllllantysiliogogogochensis]|nr:DUF305 domain-containing protein [Myxococcus llanfairpwllgwyngyllgogerychwyrndrobwllllantysiliogogogochensis]